MDQEGHVKVVNWPRRWRPRVEEDPHAGAVSAPGHDDDRRVDGREARSPDDAAAARQGEKVLCGKVARHRVPNVVGQRQRRGVHCRAERGRENKHPRRVLLAEAGVGPVSAAAWMGLLELPTRALREPGGRGRWWAGRTAVAAVDPRSTTRLLLAGRGEGTSRRARPRRRRACLGLGRRAARLARREAHAHNGGGRNVDRTRRQNKRRTTG